MHDVNSSSHNLQKCLSGRHSLPALLNREVDNWVLPSISPEWIYVSIDHKYFEVGEHLPQWMGVTHATQLLQRVGKITSLTFVSLFNRIDGNILSVQEQSREITGDKFLAHAFRNNNMKTNPFLDYITWDTRRRQHKQETRFACAAFLWRRRAANPPEKDVSWMLLINLLILTERFSNYKSVFMGN